MRPSKQPAVYRRRLSFSLTLIFGTSSANDSPVFHYPTLLFFLVMGLSAAWSISHVRLRSGPGCKQEPTTNKDSENSDRVPLECANIELPG